MPPVQPVLPGPGTIDSLLRSTESIKARTTCRLHTRGGRVHAEVAVLRHASSGSGGGPGESAVLVYAPSTDESSVTILRALPITSTFSSSLLQTPPSPSTSFFAQSSKPHIELILNKGDTAGSKVALQFAPKDSVRVQALVKEIRNAVDTCFPCPFSHAWLEFYPTTSAVPPRSNAETMKADLEESFGKSDSEESSDPETPATTVNETIAPSTLNDMVVESSLKDFKDSDDGPLGTPLGTGAKRADAVSDLGSINAEDSKEPEKERGAEDNEVSALSAEPETEEREGEEKAKESLTAQEDATKEAKDRRAAAKETRDDGDEKYKKTEEEEDSKIEKEPKENTDPVNKPDKQADKVENKQETTSPTLQTKTDEPDPNAEDDQQDSEDERFPNPYKHGFSRTRFLRTRLFERQNMWSSTQAVSLRVVTYNVNDRVPPAGTKELAGILGPDTEDIIAVGLQEVDLRGSALFVSQGKSRADSWETAILAGLGDARDDYKTIATVQYVGVLLLIFARKKLSEHITAVQDCARGIGLLGVGGNKAGVSVRLKVHDTTLTFITSHLAAYTNQLERRRSDYQVLRTGLTFPLQPAAQPALEAYYPDMGSLCVDDCDVIFWFGDLNYRLDLEDSEIRSLIEKRSWKELLLGDQLLSDVSESLSFTGFSEPDIDFKPSFKYVHGSVTLDPRRSPAYCDRALYLASGTKVVPKEYKSHELLWSDHLPVSCSYDVDVRVVDETKRSEELVAVQCELDKLDELYRANLTIDTDELDFGTVKYRRRVQREVVLRNTGRVPATFSFRTPSPGKPICKPWFWPFPSTGTVESGKELRLTVTTEVDEHHCLGLTAGDEMADVLVLQVAGGKDSFISLRAQFTPTVIGVPLEFLPELPDAITKISVADRKALLGPGASEPAAEGDESTHAKSAKPPREVWRLLEKLIDEGTGVGKLWTDEVDLPSVLGVIDALDTGAERVPGAAKPTAQALLHILYALPTPLVPDTHKQACQTAQERFEAFGVVEKIPSVHANVLIGFMSVAKLCAGEEAVDDASVAALATAVFGGAPAGREGFIRALMEG